MTASLLPADGTATAVVTLGTDAVICGTAWFDESFRQLDSSISIAWRCRDGDRLSAGDEVCRLQGPARAILSGERTALNFLQTLSATATAAREFVDCVAGTGVTILDTRKTIPGLRLAQKYAVRSGGASNHRIGLFDEILIKENHISVMGSVKAAVDQAHRIADSVPIEVEVETIDELRLALESDADRLLLDNFSTQMLIEAVSLRDKMAPGKELEASGGITLDNIRSIAVTGIDYISVGAMTKSVSAVDFSLRIVDDAD